MELMKNKRDSNIELLRIVSILIIIAHHLVHHSGMYQYIIDNNIFSLSSKFLLAFGWGGKTAINCFILITGYFMVNKNISLMKFLKLFLAIEFYSILIYFIFIISGYEAFSISSCFKAIFPFRYIDYNFVSCFLFFYLLIPFLNILIKNLNIKQYNLLLIILLGIYTILPFLGLCNVLFNYITWLCVVYLVGAYLRINPVFDRKSFGFYGLTSLALLLISWLSVIILNYLKVNYLGGMKSVYFFVDDANKILALVTAITLFLTFKNMRVKYHSSINLMATTVFGILLIHDNSSVMRRWLWRDTIDVINLYQSEYLFVYVVGLVLAVFFVCFIIDYIRIYFLETPLFNILKKYIDKMQVGFTSNLDR